MRPLHAWISTAAALFVAGTACAQSGDFAAEAARLYQRPPDIAQCEPGQLLPAQRQRALAAVNQIRRLHGLSAVGYDASREAMATQAALVVAANGQLSHFPGPTWRCISDAGQKGARSSLLYGGVVSPALAFMDVDAIIAAWLSDADNAGADGIGHRRWLLDPFLKDIAFGMVAGPLPGGAMSMAAALRPVPAAAGERASAAQDYVAWPVGDYPQRWFDARAPLSFAVFADGTRKSLNRQVDYARAEIRVSAHDGGALPVSDVRADSEGFGLPNSLRFRVAGLRPGVRYDVLIRDVDVLGAPRDYRYWFRIGP
jgi:uncharacterized protein YkwD